MANLSQNSDDEYLAYTKWGHLREAGEVYRRVRRDHPPGKEIGLDFWLAPYEVATGDRALVLRTAEDWARRRATSFVSAIEIAAMFSAAGETEAALRWLELAENEKAHGSSFIKVGMGWMWGDQLRESPRFKAILGRMRFPG